MVRHAVLKTVAPSGWAFDSPALLQFALYCRAYGSHSVKVALFRAW